MAGYRIPAVSRPGLRPQTGPVVRKRPMQRGRRREVCKKRIPNLSPGSRDAKSADNRFAAVGAN